MSNYYCTLVTIHDFPLVESLFVGDQVNVEEHDVT